MDLNKRSGSASRPFYELPAHIKPCSRIIKEARMQLSGGLSKDFSALSLGNSGASGDCNPSNAAFTPGSLKPVNTKRPFTPRDSVSLWGMSARKRPPSAITLSRLSIEETEESLEHNAKAGASRQSASQFSPQFLSGSRKARSDSVPETALTDKDSALERNNRRSFSLNTFGREASIPPCVYEVNDDLSHTMDEDNGDSSSAYIWSITNLKEMVDCLNDLVSKYGLPHDAESGKIKELMIEALKKSQEFVDTLKNDNALKNRLLKVVFKLVEKNQADEDILFWASFLLLQCQIIGSNLTTVFKMVYKASRCKEYWEVILKSEYLDVFMESFTQICPKSQTESMIYGYGTLKFICSDKSVLHRILDLNLITIMALHLKILNYEVCKMKKIPEYIMNGVFQLTSILRTVVGEEDSVNLVFSSGLLQEVATSLLWTIDDLDVLLNIVRILSVVTGEDEACHILASSSYICEAIAKIFQEWYSKEDIIVRTTYFVGNLLASSDDIRVNLYEEPDVFRLTLQLLNYYKEKSSAAAMDILVKTIRMIANWSLNGDIGSDLSEFEELTIFLKEILQLKDATDELLLCTIASLNNLSFYKNYNLKDEHSLQIAECLLQFLIHKNEEIRVECLKVLGNLTRNSEIRDYVSQYLSQIVSLLEEDSREDLLYSSCGVIMNIIVNEEAQKEFHKIHGVQVLMRIFEATEEICFLLIIAQIIWNLVVCSHQADFNMNNQKWELQKSFERKLEDVGNIRMQHMTDDEPETMQYLELIEDFEVLSKNLIQKLAS